MNMKLKMKIILLALLGLIFFAGLWPSSAQRGQGVRIKADNGAEIDLYDESYALVIGVSKYTNGWRVLPGVSRDVTAVNAVLTKQGFTVKVVTDPTFTQMDQAIRDFISEYGLKQRNRLLIYFAGHGYTELRSDGRDLGYIIPADAPLPAQNPQLFSRRAMSMDDMEAHARRINAKHALFIFDSCFSGSIFEARSSLFVPPEIASKTAAPVRQFITSGTKNQTVPDTSIFRLYFVRAFEQREGDLNHDDFITGEELGIYLSGKVSRDSREAQTPRYGKINDARLNIGDMVFVLPAAPVVVTPTNTSEAFELAFWNSINASRSAQDFDAYLEQYPNGRFASLARNKKAQLLAELRRPDPLKPVNSNLVFTATPFTTAKLMNGNVTRSQAVCESYFEDLGNGVKLEMARVPAGKFLMGSPASEPDRKDDEGPQREVSISSFLMGRFEVTQQQWRVVAGWPKVGIELNANPAQFKGDSLPVEMISWLETKEFIARLNKKLGLTEGNEYRLPSEAEWEYAARSGTTTTFAFGSVLSAEVVNFDGRLKGDKKDGASVAFRNKPVAVGSIGIANAWGLFDLYGNLWEWCEDDWHPTYENAPQNGRPWITDLSSREPRRLIRGGSFGSKSGDCRAARRIKNVPDFRGPDLGFRLARTIR